MITIYKYNLKITDEQEIELPKDHDILSVQMQNGSLQLWAIVDTENEKVKETIYIVGTGNTVEFEIRDAIYINTFQAFNGSFVGHAFLKLQP